MSEQAALAFRKLVASMRTLEKQYWARRDKGVLRQSIELEKRVDETIMKVDPQNVPQTDNGNFLEIGDHSIHDSWMLTYGKLSAH